MKCLFPVPKDYFDYLREKETGIGYYMVSVVLKDGRRFDQVVVSEGCVIQVRGYSDIPFAPHEMASVSANHNRWNFRDLSDVRVKSRAATA
jgi:hypothetical protein